ncbi:MAG: hypothetical protein PHO56_03115 [Patescibacteria group bacterium]|nr:hypothetical protein [Patescibacteria group bacterium]
MNFITALLNAFLISHALELGMIPNSDVSLYAIPYHQEYLHTEESMYAEYSTKMTIAKIGFVTGGVTTYWWNYYSDQQKCGYPFRMDYKIGGGVKYKWITLGVDYGCYHPIAPREENVPLPRLDANFTRIFLRFETKNFSE